MEAKTTALEQEGAAGVLRCDDGIPGVFEGRASRDGFELDVRHG